MQSGNHKLATCAQIKVHHQIQCQAADQPLTLTWQEKFMEYLHETTCMWPHFGMEKFQQSWWTLSQNQIQYPQPKKKLYMIRKLDTGKHGYLKGSRLNRITENNPVTKENNLQQRCTNSFIRNLYTSHVINPTQFSLPLKLNVGQKKTTTTNKQNSSLIVKPVKICCW